MEGTYSMRMAEQKDAEDILRLLKELSVHLKTPGFVQLTITDVSKDMSTWYHCILLKHQPSDQDKPQEVVGCVIWYYSYSMDMGRTGFMEALYINAEHRGHGNGSRLMKRVAKICYDMACKGLKWEVASWNEPAKSFYDKFNPICFSEKLDLSSWQVGGDEFVKLANETT